MKARRLLVELLTHVARAAGLPSLERRRRHRRGDYRLYVLEYHEVCGTAAEEREGVVSAERLARHLRFLGPLFRCVTLAEGAKRLAAGEPLEEDLLALTFDDGYLGNERHAWPVLRAAGVPGTVYLATAFLDGDELWFDFARRAFRALRGREEALPASAQEVLATALGSWPSSGGEVERLKYAPLEIRHEALHVLSHLDLDLEPAALAMDWRAARRMVEEGAEMGAHTVNHPILSRLDAHQQEEEIQRSRQRITEEVGHEPETFAVPNGSQRDFDAATLEILQRLGFRASCTTVRGSNRPGCDLFTLRRLGIGADSTSLLAARLAGFFDQGLRHRLPGGMGKAPGH